jgi:hypothetical protein
LRSRLRRRQSELVPVLCRRAVGGGGPLALGIHAQQRGLGRGGGGEGIG